VVPLPRSSNEVCGYTLLSTRLSLSPDLMTVPSNPVVVLASPSLNVDSNWRCTVVLLEEGAWERIDRELGKGRVGRGDVGWDGGGEGKPEET
jgi:hypothetical protein